MEIFTDGQISYTSHCPNCPNVKLPTQHIFIYRIIQARLFKISPKDPEDLIYYDKDVEVAEAVYDSDLHLLLLYQSTHHGHTNNITNKQ
ncbi:hypothetical protein TNCV_1481061 [Trichonephila clavipes]|nr:hypothetical protein TNCV_1481061 [Trichonephila clavipes]